MPANPGNLILCLEDEAYRRYLEQELSAAGVPHCSIAHDRLAQVIAENPTGILVLQSETAEQNTIELSSRIKRLFNDDIGVLLLSADYLTRETAGASVDAFLQYPTSFEEVRRAITSIQDKNRRILLIDDSKLIHNYLVPQLREQGYEVFQAFDGQEGVRKAKDCLPHLIICDIEMPNMNGFDACSAIRQIPEIADCHIIMSSTLGSAADQQRGFQSGVDEYIQKPVVIPELCDRIKKVFNRARGGREAILIVESDKQIANSISKCLMKQGFSTRITGDLKEVRRAVKRAAYDLAISEMTLPDGTLLDLMTTVRSLPPEKQPEILILTSRGNHADTKMVLNAGAAGVISKPFTMDSLLASVERTLADRRASMEKMHLQKYVSQASLRMALEKSILSGKSTATRAYAKKATVFFSDIVSFTHRCESYPPQEVVTQVNTLFDVMTRVIISHSGDIDKFIGDACMAFWMDEDPAVSSERAIRATLEIRTRIDEMNLSNPILAKDPIHIRMGINTGDVILCDIGAADARMNLTIIGDTVNIAARLESASKQYGVSLLVGEATYKSVQGKFAARQLDVIRVKGKNNAVGCYELFAETGKTTSKQDQLIATFEVGLEAYRNGQFKQALEAFHASEVYEDGYGTDEFTASVLYQQRCRQLIENPPAKWDGIWTLQSK